MGTTLADKLIANEIATLVGTDAFPVLADPGGSPDPGMARLSAILAYIDVQRPRPIEATFYKNTTQSLSSGSEQDISFQVRDGDNLGMTPTTIFTIPAALNGRRMRLIAQADSNDGTNASKHMRVYLGGARIGEQITSGAYAQAGGQCISRWVTVATGNTFKATITPSGAQTLTGDATNFLTVEFK